MLSLLNLDGGIAKQIVETDLEGFKSERFRLTTRLTIFNRVNANSVQIEGLTKDLEILENIITEYEKELSLLP